MENGKFHLMHKWWDNPRTAQSVIPLSVAGGVATAVREDDQAIIDYILNKTGPAPAGISPSDTRRRVVLLPVRNTVRPNVYRNAEGLIERVVAVGSGEKGMTPMEAPQLGTDGKPLKRNAFPPMQSSNAPPYISQLITSFLSDTQYELIVVGGFASYVIAWNSTSSGPQTSSLYLVDGLLANTQYTFTVTPYSTLSVANTSNALQTSVKTLPAVMWDPSGFAAAPVVGFEAYIPWLATTTSSYNYVVVTWSPSGTSGVQTGTSYTATGFSGGENVTFTITPYDSSGVAGAGVVPYLPYIISSTIAAPPATLDGVTLSSITASGTIVNVSGSYTNFAVTWNNGSNSSGLRSGTSYSATGLSANTLYTFSVVPYNSDGVVNTGALRSASTVTMAIAAFDNATIANATRYPYEAFIAWTGSYAYVIVTWNNGAQTSGNQTGTSYSATGLQPGSRQFGLTPYNSSGVAGTTTYRNIDVVMPAPTGSDPQWVEGSEIGTYYLKTEPLVLVINSLFVGDSMTITSSTLNLMNFSTPNGYVIDNDGTMTISRQGLLTDATTFMTTLTATNTGGSLSLLFYVRELNGPTLDLSGTYYGTIDSVAKTFEFTTQNDFNYTAVDELSTNYTWTYGLVSAGNPETQWVATYYNPTLSATVTDAIFLDIYNTLFYKAEGSLYSVPLSRTPPPPPVISGQHNSLGVKGSPFDTVWLFQSGNDGNYDLLNSTFDTIGSLVYTPSGSVFNVQHFWVATSTTWSGSVLLKLDQTLYTQYDLVGLLYADQSYAQTNYAILSYFAPAYSLEGAWYTNQVGTQVTNVTIVNTSGFNYQMSLVDNSRQWALNYFTGFGYAAWQIFETTNNANDYVDTVRQDLANVFIYNVGTNTNTGVQKLNVWEYGNYAGFSAFARTASLIGPLPPINLAGQYDVLNVNGSSYQYISIASTSPTGNYVIYDNQGNEIGLMVYSYTNNTQQWTATSSSWSSYVIVKLDQTLLANGYNAFEYVDQSYAGTNLAFVDRLVPAYDLAGDWVIDSDAAAQFASRTSDSSYIALAGETVTFVKTTDWNYVFELSDSSRQWRLDYMLASMYPFGWQLVETTQTDVNVGIIFHDRPNAFILDALNNVNIGLQRLLVVNDTMQLLNAFTRPAV